MNLVAELAGKLKRDLVLFCQGKISLREIWVKIKGSSLRVRQFRILRRFCFPIGKVICGPVETSDAQALVLFHSRQSREALPLEVEQIKKRLKNPLADNYFYVAKYRGKIVGQVGMSKCWGESYGVDEWVITGLWMLNSYRGLGIGKKLIKKPISDAKSRGISKILVSVYTNNHSAINLYQKVGFKQISNPQLEAKINCSNQYKKVPNRFLLYTLPLRG